MPMQRFTAFVIPFLAWYLHTAQPSHASFLHYTTDQGLSNDHVSVITKDKLGFLWVGTINGLNRFDGRAFKIFRHDPKNQHSIPGNHIFDLTLAPDGWLWIATSGGLCKLDPLWLDIQRITLPENTDSLENDIVTGVVFDSGGMAWTTGDKGIYKIHPVTGSLGFTLTTREKALGFSWIMMDTQNRLWMCKDSVRCYDPTTGSMRAFSGVNMQESFIEATPLCLVEDSSGTIWAGTWYNGIWKYTDELNEFIKLPSSPRFASKIMLDDSTPGNPFFWVGGGQSGLGIYYLTTEQFVECKPDPRDPFTHNNYLAKTLFRDASNGDVWIGTEVGLEHYAPAAIRFGRAIIPPEKDMGQFSLVSGVVHDHLDPTDQRYFVALWGTGLFAWNKASGNFTRLKSTRSKMTGGSNFSLLQDNQGYLWACMKDGVGRYDPRTGEFRDYEKFFQHNERNNLIWCGLEDQRGNVWFGSNKEGLFRYNPYTDNIERVFYSKEFANEDGYLNILDISEDHAGRLWLACNVGGIIRFDPVTGMAQQFSYADRTIPIVCSAIEAGSNGRIYAAFYDAFVELDSDGKLLRHFTQGNGLKTNRMNFMLEDGQGNIWFNSDYLLHCFNPESGSFYYYGKADGLFSNTMTDALCITRSGEIFVGFQNAFNFFYPDRLRRNLQPPPIAITSIKVMNKERQVITRSTEKLSLGLIPSHSKSIKHDTFLHLRPNEDFFEIEFAALNFNQPERNRYAYFLEGFNKEWVYTDRPVATFTNLDGGIYLLRMKAANNDGVWNEQGATLEIHVNPPFYKTWWFFILIALAIAGIVAGLLWFRRQHRRRLEKFRESLARDLHDEMGSTLSSIRFFSDFAHQQIGNDKPQVTPMLQRISQSASNLSESMQDIIWAMKAQNDQLEDTVAHMTEFGLRILEARNVQFKTHIATEFSGKQLRPEVRRNLYLIFKEAINNVAKYAEATEVELTLGMKNGILSMKISDNGKGFDPGSSPAVGGGNGMQNMHKRATDIGGKVDIVSGPGKGTRVEFEIKV